MNICSGSAFLVAPVTEQGTTKRQVYLPAGRGRWYNYWTNERVKGGQTITVDAPIDTIPLFVRAGLIIPLGSYIENTEQTQKIATVSVYPGADADFTLFQDDGNTYAYEKGDAKITRLHWSDAAHQLGHMRAQRHGAVLMRRWWNAVRSMVVLSWNRLVAKVFAGVHDLNRL